jgi:IS5 family transposase
MGRAKFTRRERFLAEMDAVIPWSRLVRLIEPHCSPSAQVGHFLAIEEERVVGSS